MKKLKMIFGFAGLACFLTETSAHAYIDGGTGSMLLQVLLAGAAGVAVMARLFFRRLFKRGKPDDGETKP